MNLFWTAADGSGPAEQLTRCPNEQVPTSVSPDGKLLAFDERSLGGAPPDLWLRRLDGNGQVELLLGSPAYEANAVFSPNGRWIAYVAGPVGLLDNDVYVRPVSDSSRKWQVSVRGETNPQWSPTGGEIFFYQGGTFSAVPVTSESPFRVGAPKPLFQRPLSPRAGHPLAYYPAPDGQRFLMLEPQAEIGDLRIVLNWTEELKAKMADK